MRPLSKVLSPGHRFIPGRRLPRNIDESSFNGSTRRSTRHVTHVRRCHFFSIRETHSPEVKNSGQRVTVFTLTATCRYDRGGPPCGSCNYRLLAAHFAGPLLPLWFNAQEVRSANAKRGGGGVDRRATECSQEYLGEHVFSLWRVDFRGHSFDAMTEILHWSRPQCGMFRIRRRSFIPLAAAAAAAREGNVPCLNATLSLHK